MRDRPPRQNRRARAQRGFRSAAFLPRGGLVREAGFDLAGDFCESRLVEHRQVREHLAVDLDIGALQARHERAVGHSELAHRRVDAGDPQRAERALLLPAVTVSVLPGLHPRLLGDPVDVAAAAAESLGLLEDLLVARARRYSTFDSWHGALLIPSTAAWNGSRPCWWSPPGWYAAAGAWTWWSSWAGDGADRR